jgi:hypothetical protein
MLQKGDILRTWALTGEPAPEREIEAQELGEHRLDYLDFEGPVSQNRGTVTQWDAGEYELLANSPSELKVKMQGRRLLGAADLQRDADDPQRWRFRFTASA